MPQTNGDTNDEKHKTEKGDTQKKSFFVDKIAEFHTTISYYTLLRRNSEAFHIYLLQHYYLLKSHISSCSIL